MARTGQLRAGSILPPEPPRVARVLRGGATGGLAPVWDRTARPNHGRLSVSPLMSSLSEAAQRPVSGGGAWESNPPLTALAARQPF
jgi:hypothetical protein